MKRTNKGAQPEISGQPPAEFVEKRPPAEGNRVQTAVTGTQGLEAASNGLNRVREAAKRDKYLHFTNEVDLYCTGAAPLPESTFLRLT